MNALEVERAQYIKQVINALAEAGRGQKGVILRDAMAHLCCSKDKLYQEMAQLGWTSGRKRRSDKGRTSLTQEEAQLIANLMRQSERDSGKRLMTIADAIDIAYANGKLGEKVSVSTASRALTRFNLHPDQVNQMESTIQQRSLHPNHVWQFDVSICVLYYLRDRQGLRVMPRDEFYANKPHNLERIKNERVLRYLVTDHYSGAFFVRYYVAPGENTETISRFLLEAFSQRATGEQVYGVPKILVWDAGSANIAHQTQHLLNLLDVRHIAHTPGRPWAKGQVETTHNLVERHFEGRLAFTHVESLESLNAELIQWSVSYQSFNAVRRHRATRFGMWQRIKAEQLRLIPDVELVKSLMQQTRPEVRTVKANQLSISFAPKGYGSLEYSLAHIPHVSAGDEVTVTVNPYKAPAIRVISQNAEGEEFVHEALPIERDEAGFNVLAPVIGEKMASIRDTDSDKQRKALDVAAYGTDNPRDVKKLRKRQVPALNGEIDPMADVRQQNVPVFMAKKGQHLALSSPVITENSMSLLGMLNQARMRLRPARAELVHIRRVLEQRFPQGGTETELNTFIEEWENNDDQLKAGHGQG